MPDVLLGIVLYDGTLFFAIFSFRCYLHPSLYFGRLNFTNFSIEFPCTLGSANGINRQEDESVARERRQEETYSLDFLS